MTHTIQFTADEIRLLDDIVAHDQASALVSRSEDSTLQALRGKIRVALNRAEPRRGLEALSDEESEVDPWQSPRLLRVLDEIGPTVSVRTRGKLLNNRIYTLAQLLQQDRYGLLSMHGFGSGCLRAVEGALAVFGLQLAEVDNG